MKDYLVAGALTVGIWAWIVNKENVNIILSIILFFLVMILIIFSAYLYDRIL
jgi:hypothetical protein